MKQVWKFELLQGLNTVSMRQGAEILSVASQNNNICIWAKVDPSETLEDRIFYVFGTGEDIDNKIDLHLIGTVLFFPVPFVFHVFEKV